MYTCRKNPYTLHTQNYKAADAGQACGGLGKSVAWIKRTMRSNAWAAISPVGLGDILACVQKGLAFTKKGCGMGLDLASWGLHVFSQIAEAARSGG